MNKDNFIKVLHHYSESSAREAEDVLLLKKDYPYSQVLHTLSARVSKDHGFSSHQTELQLAAIYAADRTVLKDIMTFEPEEDDDDAPYIQPVNSPVQRNFTPAATTISEDLASEVIHDLERLHELKHNFEMLFVDVPPTAPQPQQAAEIAPPVQTPPQPTTIVEPTIAQTPTQVPTPAKRVIQIEKSKEEEPPKEDTKSRKQRIIELAKARNPVEDTPPQAVEPPRIKARPPRRRKEDGDTLIDEIANTKEELAPENEKQKEQIDLIDQFIKSQPSFVNTKEKANQPAADLTAVKPGEFSDNIVSETLVEILIKQGKKDKAIEVLKKLIWKFPQKKAYFAAQIEELKK